MKVEDFKVGEEVEVTYKILGGLMTFPPKGYDQWHKHIITEDEYPDYIDHMIHFDQIRKIDGSTKMHEL